MEKERGRHGGKWGGRERVACMTGTISHTHTHTVPDYAQGSQGPTLTEVCPSLSHTQRLHLVGPHAWRSPSLSCSRLLHFSWGNLCFLCKWLSSFCRKLDMLEAKNHTGEQVTLSFMGQVGTKGDFEACGVWVCAYVCVCASKRAFDLGLYLCFRCVLSSLQGEAFFWLLFCSVPPFMLIKPHR